MNDFINPERIEDILVNCVRRSSEFVMAEPHFHSYYEFYYLISGQCKMFIRQDLYYLRPGDMIIIRPGEIHKSLYEKDWNAERFMAYFTQEYVDAFQNSCGRAAFDHMLSSPRVSVPLAYQATADSLFRQMVAEDSRSDAFSAIQLKSALYQLLVILGRCRGTGERRENLEEAENAVMEAARYIYEHHRENVTLEQAADAAYMSPTYFSKKFKSVTGFGFKEYLNSIRLREAEDMLKNTGLGITEIALSCGFSDGNYFGDVFKKAKGVPPRQYRKLS